MKDLRKKFPWLTGFETTQYATNYEHQNIFDVFGFTPSYNYYLPHQAETSSFANAIQPSTQQSASAPADDNIGLQTIEPGTPQADIDAKIQAFINSLISQGITPFVGQMGTNMPTATIFGVSEFSTTPLGATPMDLVISPITPVSMGATMPEYFQLQTTPVI